MRAGTQLKAVLVWTDPPGAQLVNDLDLRVVTPSGQTRFGNGSQRDRVNNVEAVTIDAPATGSYAFSVDATNITSGPRQSYALVITGDFASVTQESGKRRAARH